METPFLQFDREQWARLRQGTPMTLSLDDLQQLRGINDRLDLAEVAEIYLPLSRLLNLYVKATQDLYSVSSEFLGHPDSRPVPYVIGIAGSVSAGKSTTARLLKELLARWPNSPKVDLVTTDGFLYPNAELERRGLMERKGFPGSYDVKRLVKFVADIKCGQNASHPIYSHLTYDILPNHTKIVARPDIVIVEGLNVLQPGSGSQAFLSDFFDFSIYVDADETDLERWYIERFIALRDTAFTQPESYFHRYRDLDDTQAEDFAKSIWHSINLPNLRENILPTRDRARLRLLKGADHAIKRVHLRKL